MVVIATEIKLLLPPLQLALILLSKKLKMNRSGQELFIRTLNFPAVSLFASQVIGGGNIGKAACMCSFSPPSSFFESAEFIRHYAPAADFFVLSCLEREVV